MNAVSAANLKRLALLLIVALLLLPAGCIESNVESTVNWLYAYDQALSEAQRENKPVMITFWASWCGPCREMDRTTYADEEVGAFLNENFVNLKVDVDRSNLALTYNIRSIPQVVFLSPEGTEIIGSRIVGARSPQAFLALVEAVLNEWKQQP